MCMKNIFLDDIDTKLVKLKEVEKVVSNRDAFKLTVLMQKLDIVRENIVDTENLNTDRISEFISNLDDEINYFIG